MNKIQLLIVFIFIGLHLEAATLTGSFGFEWSECKLMDSIIGKSGAGELGKVRVGDSIGLKTVCIKKDKIISCDYIHEKTGKPKNQPSLYYVEMEVEGYIFASTENKSSRLYINLINKAVVSYDFILSQIALDYFGMKMCSGKILKN